MLRCQWFDIETVGDIEVGGDGFGLELTMMVFAAELSVCQRGECAAGVEFQPLPDAFGPLARITTALSPIGRPSSISP